MESFTEENFLLFAECQHNTIFIKTIIEIVSHISSCDYITSAPDKNNIKQIFFKFSKSNIEIYSDTLKVLSISTVLEKSFFSVYSFSDEYPMCIGISLDILKSCFKYVHRNDILTIKIRKDGENYPDVIEFVLNGNKGFSIKFNIVQNIDTDTYDGFTKFLEIDSSQFSNIHKEIGGVKKKVDINIDNDKKILKLSSNMIDIAENWVEFNITESVPEEFPVNKTIIKSEYFKMISKISTFDHKIKMFLDENTNIRFFSNLINYKENKRIIGTTNVILNVGVALSESPIFSYE